MLLNYYVLTVTPPDKPGKKAKTEITRCKGSFASSLDDSYTDEINKLIKYLLDNFYITITPDDYNNSSKFYFLDNTTGEKICTVLDGVSTSKIDANNLKIEDALSIICSKYKDTIADEQIPVCIKDSLVKEDRKASRASLTSSDASTSTDDSDKEDSPRTSKSFKR